MMRRTLVLLLSLAMVLVTASCGQSGASSAAGATPSDAAGSPKTDLVIAAATEAVTLDPQGGWDGASLYVLRQLYNGLVKLDNNMEIVGDLAESWEFTTDTSVTFKLKQGVKFHNGEEMKASDVVYSIQRAQESPKVKALPPILCRLSQMMITQ